MIAILGVLPVLIAENEGIDPVPVAANPIVESELVQAYVMPGSVLVKIVGSVNPVLHTTILAGCAIVGVGLTIRACVCDVDPHSLVTSSFTL